MQFFKDKKQTSSSGGPRNHNAPGDRDSRESSTSRTDGSSGGSSGGKFNPAAVISVLITACLLIAGGIFVISGTRRPADASGKQPFFSSQEFRTWLGLDPIQRILSPVPEDSAAYIFSEEASREETAEDTAAGVNADAASLNAVEGSSARNAAADSEKPASAEQFSAKGTSEKAGRNISGAAPSAKDSSTAVSAAASGATGPGQTAAADKDSSLKAKSGETASQGTTTTSQTAKAAGQSGKSSDEKDSGAKKEAEAGKDSGDKKEAGTDKKEKEEDEDGSLTKTQKKYVQSWEENHFRPFPLTTGLHDYNWKYLKYDDDGVLQYKGDENYTVRRGIDVSEFQGKIDWEEVKKEGYDFVFVRAGHRTFHTGTLEKDTRAIKNLTRAEEAGLDVGVYVFSQAVSIEEAVEEAELCLDIIEESGVEITLPVVFDPEIQIEYDARINYISSKQFTDNAVAFCETIKEAGFTPAIYANCSTETDILNMSRLENAEIWYADYNSVPESPYRFTFWQYTNMGWVDGIPETETDLNLWFVPKSSSKKDSAKKDSSEKDNAKKDSSEKDSTKKDTSEKDSSKKDSSDKDSAKKDNTDKGGTKKVEADQNGTKKDNTDKSGTKKDGADQSGAKKDNTVKSGTKKVEADQSGAKEDNTDKGDTKKDSADKSSTKKNASDKKDSDKKADKNAGNE